MSRSSKFPDVEEFRARAAKLGFSTGVSHGRIDPAPEPEPQNTSARPVVLWGFLGVAAASLLGWLMVEQGGPARFADALGLDQTMFTSTGPTTTLPMIAANQPSNGQLSNDQLREIAALRARLGRLENDRLAAARRNQAARAPTAGQTGFDPGAPVQTGSLSSPRVIPPRPLPPSATKQDAPEQSSNRAPTAIVALPLPSAGVERSRLAKPVQFGLDLGGYATLSDLTSTWARVRTGNGDLLAGLAPRQVTEFSASGARAFRLIAGPVDKIADAVQICAIFRSRGIACRQTISAGEPL